MKMDNYTEINTQLTRTSFEVDPYPDYTDTQGALLGIYAIEASARFEAFKPFACIIAQSEEAAWSIAMGEGLISIEEIKLIGYALPRYTKNKVVYLNRGEFLHENINN